VCVPSIGTQRLSCMQWLFPSATLSLVQSARKSTEVRGSFILRRFRLPHRFGAMGYRSGLGKALASHQKAFLSADLPFLERQLSQESIQVLLLNGKGIVSAYQELLHGRLLESSVPEHARLKLFSGRDPRGFLVIGWNINLQSSFGVSNYEIGAIGSAVKNAFAAEPPRHRTTQAPPPSEKEDTSSTKKWWRRWNR
jgi:hypothetical protein